MVLKYLLLAISTMIKRFLEDYTKIPRTSKSAISYHKRIIKAIVEKDSDLAEAERIAHPMDVIKTLREKLNLNVRLSDWTKGGDKQFRLKRKVEYGSEQKNDRVPPRRYLRWKRSKLGME